MKRLNVIQRTLEGSAGQVLKGMATMAVGSGAAKGIGLLAMPLLTRLYSPEDYGVLSVFTAVIFLLLPFVTFRYVMALPLPRRDALAINILALSACIMLAVTGLITLTFALAGEALLTPFSMEILAPMWWLIGLGLLGTASYETATLWASRRRAYKPIARSQIIQSINGTIVKLVLGLLGFTSFGLLVGQVLYQSAGTGSLLRRFKEDLQHNWHHVTWYRIRKAARLYRRFPVWRMPSQFLQAFSVQAPVPLTALLYDPGTTGQLGLAIMAITLPMALIGDNMSKAYYAEIADIGKRDPAKIRKVTASVIRTLALLATIPVAVLILAGEPLFAFVFGQEWATAGRFTVMLTPYLFFNFVTMPIVRVFSVLGQEKTFLLVNVRRTLFILIAYAFGWLQGWPVEFTLWLFSGLISVHMLLIVVFVFRSLEQETRRLERIASRP